ncbi:response regulator [Desulfobulbus alkaliphilus]|uniref:response regulator n=1 Tax=Desulfobulbus alkaliphilus TaxID=869814 RepID=UPI001962F24D|nr:response regulator [Desulfobulbus alkaliphilus]MBM9535653.1 response regulator [Desulfobulbus alkaliphilus]
MAHILVIDDEESILFTLDRFLSAEKHKVSTADSYCAALSRIDEEYFDLILADINLGDGWGIDILHVVVRRDLNTRVIIMTAYPTSETRAESLRRHAKDYLVKPLRQKNLVRSVENVLQ